MDPKHGAESPEVDILRTIAAEVPGIVFMVDREGTILLEEGRDVGLLGRPSELVIGRSLFDVFAHRPEVVANARRALAGEEFTVDLAIGAEGERTLQVRYAPVRTGPPESPVVGFLGIAHDVTEERRLQRDLLASQMMYKTVIDTTDTGYVVTDMEGRVIDANDEYVRLAGRSSLKDVRGKSVLEWTAPHDLERNQREVEKCLRLGRVRNLCIDYVDGKGRITPIEINATFIPIGKSGRILCLCRDVSERRRAEATLQQSELMNRAVLDSMHAAIAVLDTHGRIVQVNAGWHRLSESAGLEDLGAAKIGDDYLAAWRKAASHGCADSARFTSALESLQEGGTSHVDFEFAPQTTGAQRRYLLRAVPLPKPPGGLVVAHLELEPQPAGSSDSALG
jgi:PAS domain S-box-containing protein